MTISATYVNTMLNQLFGSGYNSTAYPNMATMAIGLSASAPSTTGTNLTEPSGGAYARVTVTNTTTWGAAAAGTKANSVVINFPTATAAWGNVSYWFLFDSAGAFVLAGTLAGSPVNITSGSTPSFAAGALTISES